MIKALGMLTLLLAALQGSAVLAQGSGGRTVRCDEYASYTVFPPEGISARAISMRRKVFVDAVSASLTGSRSRANISVEVVTCPESDFGISIFNVSEGRRVEKIKKNDYYQLYVARSYLLHTDKVDLQREARRHVCLITTGASDRLRFDPREPDEWNVQVCEMYQAYSVHDSDYAKWLARVLGYLRG